MRKLILTITLLSISLVGHGDDNFTLEGKTYEGRICKLETKKDNVTFKEMSPGTLSGGRRVAIKTVVLEDFSNRTEGDAEGDSGNTYHKFETIKRTLMTKKEQLIYIYIDKDEKPVRYLAVAKLVPLFGKTQTISIDCNLN